VMHVDNGFTIELTESSARRSGDRRTGRSGGLRPAVIQRIFGPARSQRTRISRGHRDLRRLDRRG
jgi:hypothetical protein